MKKTVQNSSISKLLRPAGFLALNDEPSFDGLRLVVFDINTWNKCVYFVSMLKKNRNCTQVYQRGLAHYPIFDTVGEVEVIDMLC